MSKTLTNKFFTSNREKLKRLLGDGAPVVLPAHGLMQMSRDGEYPFEQERNFFYLTGINEPEWVLVFEDGEEYLIAPNLSEAEQVFNGSPDLGIASITSGIKKILSDEEGLKRLSKYKTIRGIGSIRYVLYGKLSMNQYPGSFSYKINLNENVVIENIEDEILKLRTIKQPEEITEIKKAIKITREAFELADKHLSSVKHEAELESIFTGYFRTKKTRHAYSPIVAAGANACTLHYTVNNESLKDKGLVLMDIGARSKYYAADVTRTRILTGVSERQLEVKKAVEKTFGQILKIIKPGLSFTDYHSKVNEIMASTLASLKLKDDKWGLKDYFPHAPTHGLGLDVHDPIVGYEEFTPGMVTTLEPGIYIPEEGIGVRYEDDLLITVDGVKNLSQKIGE